MIREWNRNSLAVKTGYSIAVKTGYSIEVEEPDEEPLDSKFFIECVSNMSLLLKVQRNFEIFPHHSQLSYGDILAIKLMNRVFGRKGNVMTMVSYKI